MSKIKLGTTSFSPLNPFDWATLAGTVPSRVNVAYNSPYSVEAAKANAERDKLAYGRRKERYEAMTGALDIKQQAEFAVQNYKAVKGKSKKQKANDSRYAAIAEARQKSAATIGMPLPELGG